MTNQELIKILDEKIENARNDRERKRNDLSNSKEWRDNESIRLYGEIQAYTDIKNLLKNEVLENDKQRKN